MSTSLAGLGADEVAPDVDGLLHMFGVADHVHDGDTCFMQSIHNFLWWDTNGGDEEGSFLFNDNLDQIWQLTLRVVELQQRSDKGNDRVREAGPYVGLACTPTYLWEEEVNTEGCVRVFKVLLNRVDLIKRVGLVHACTKFK